MDVLDNNGDTHQTIAVDVLLDDCQQTKPVGVPELTAKSAARLRRRDPASDYGLAVDII